MSKADAQRAMREANFARRQSAPSPAAAGAEPSKSIDLCGHRGMGNKACRLPSGHAEKNHRYK